MTTGTAETVPAAARSTRTDGSTEKATRTRRTRTNAGEGRRLSRYFLAEAKCRD